MSPETIEFILKQTPLVVFMLTVIFFQQKEKNALKEDLKLANAEQKKALLLISDQNAAEVKALNIELNKRATDAIEAITENSVAVSALHGIVRGIRDNIK